MKEGFIPMKRESKLVKCLDKAWVGPPMELIMGLRVKYFFWIWGCAMSPIKGFPNKTTSK